MRDPRTFRRFGIAFAMIGSPIAAIVGWLAWPTLTRDATAFFTDTADLSRLRVFGATALWTIAVALAVVAIVGLIHMLRDRKIVGGPGGGALAILGMTAFAAALGTKVALGELAFSSTPDTYKVALFDRLRDSTVMLVPLAGLFVMAFGMLLLAYALFRARVVPVPSAALLGACGVVLAVGYALFAPVVVLAAFVILGVALIPVGIELLVEPNEAWDHQPEIHGYHIGGVHA